MRFTKLIARVAAVAMLVAQLSTFSFAATSDGMHTDEARGLYDLGLFRGTNPDSFVPMLEDALDREQGIALLLRLLGKESAANEMTDAEVTNTLNKYSDMSEVQPWALKGMAYVVKTGMVIGTSDTTLSPIDPLAGNAYATMILRNLGYPVDGADAYNAAANTLDGKGATGVSAFGVKPALIRDDAVVMSLKALLAKYSVDGKTIIEALVDMGIMKKEMAIEVLSRFGMVIPGYIPEFTGDVKADKETLTADTSSSTLVTFELKDANGALIDEDATIRFESSLGKFDKEEVKLVKGVATAMLTAQYLSETQDAIVTATVKAAKTEKYLNLKTTHNIKFIANVVVPGGAAMVAVKALGADRVIAKFDRPVDLNNYIDPGTKKIDATKCTVLVRKASTSATTGFPCKVKGFLPVSGDPTSLQILLDTETFMLNSWNSLQDNAQVWVKFTDITKEAQVDRELSFNFMDTTRPSVVKVEATSYYTLKVTYNEPVYYDKWMYLDFFNHQNDFAQLGMVKYSAQNPGNYKIDGINLLNARWGNDTTVRVGAFDPLTGVDKRNIVTITLGRVAGKRVALPLGNHSLKVIDVGDWAEPNDLNNNDVDPEQDIDFVIARENVVPVASIKVLSPETYVLSFDKDVAATSQKIADNIELQRYSPITASWVKVCGAYANQDPSSQNNGKQKILVTKSRDLNGDLLVANPDNEDLNSLGNQFVLKCDDDWSRALNGSNERFYYSSKYRIKLNGDAAQATDTSEGNSEANLELTGPMTAFDTTSPTVTSMTATIGTEDGVSYDVIMSEPVKFDATLNREGITTSLDQQAGSGVPVPKVRFVNKKDPNKIIYGVIKRINSEATQFRVTMLNNAKLNPGDWTMVMTSTSDDVGNTLNNATIDFSVVDNNGFRVLWFFADTDTDKVVQNTDPSDDDSAFDYVFVKYSRPIAVSGQYDEAFNISNYQINGRALPSQTTIDNSINGFDEGTLDGMGNTVCDSVTIKLPNGYLESLRGVTSTGGTNNITLTVKGNVCDADGNTLKFEADIPHQAPYYDNRVDGNDTAFPYFGHLGYLEHGKDSPAVNAWKNFTLYTIPKAGTKLNIGNRTVGFNNTGFPMIGCNMVINVAVETNITPTDICTAIGNASVMDTGDTSCSSTGNTIRVTANAAGYLGNNILVSVINY